MTRVVPVDPASPRRARLVEAVRALESGGIVALPTETFYGLAADAFDPKALVAVNRLKGKPDGAPVLLLLPCAQEVDAVATAVPEVFWELADRFWPGPLTLVVPARPGLAAATPNRAGLPTVAVRVPGLALPRRLGELLGRPISGVSANRHGARPCRTAAEVRAAFASGLDVLLDGGSTVGGAPSTIVDLTARPPCIVRQGVLPQAALGPVLAVAAAAVRD